MVTSDAHLVVTRHRESLGWAGQYAGQPVDGSPALGTWRVFAYVHGNASHWPPECGRQQAACIQIDNRGNEWAGYLHHIVSHYDKLARLTVFVQGNPFTVSPDLTCLLKNTRAFAPIQALSWVQQKKRRNELFECNASYVNGCRVWVEPVSSGFRPLLHSDRYVAGSFPPAKPWKAMLAQWAILQLFGPLVGATSSTDTSEQRPQEPKSRELQEADARSGRKLARRRRLSMRRRLSLKLARQLSLATAHMPPQLLYRTYGSQFAASRSELQRVPMHVWRHMLCWLTSKADFACGFEWSLKYAGQHRVRGMLLELAWMTLLRADRFIAKDLCARCCPLATRTTERRAPACNATYFLGAPIREQCALAARDSGYGDHLATKLEDSESRVHAHCNFTINVNADRGEGQRQPHFRTLPSDIPVPWLASHISSRNSIS